jgi:RNA polymerase sigma factor (sigma-70 family)
MDIIAKIKLYNAYFRKARLKVGFDTMIKLSNFTGISTQNLIEYKEDISAKVHDIIQESGLSEREKKVIKLRFFDDKTMEETGEEIEGIKSKKPVSRTRVNQIESKALKKLRHPSLARELREIYEELT